MSTLRQAAQQALEAMRCAVPTGKITLTDWYKSITALRAALAEPDGTSVQQSMQTVREGFGRTMSYLTEVFGVSRQTLYNWLSGEKAPSPEHEGKIHQLEVASQRFMELGFKPSSSQLTRTLAQGKSFLELLAAGGDGATNADKLVNLVQRGQHSRARLEALARTVMLDQTSHDTALEAALAEPEYPLGQATTDVGVPVYVVKKAEPVQEPVALAWSNLEGTKFVGNGEKWKHKDCVLPLYTAPPASVSEAPQRKPLSEEEIKAALISVDSETKRLPPGFRDFARAVEAAHEIKEGA